MKEKIYIIVDGNIIQIKATFYGFMAEGLFYFSGGDFIKIDRDGFFTKEEAEKYLEKSKQETTS